jgi:hypothetical protein
VFVTSPAAVDYDRYGSLPACARRTLAGRGRDRRPWVYSLADLEAGRTHVKKILEW